MTTTCTGEGQTAVFVAIDHHSAECVGLRAARRGTRFEALESLRQGVRQHFGGFAKGVAAGLSSPPRSRQPIHVRRVPEGTEVPQYQELARFRPCA